MRLKFQIEMEVADTEDPPRMVIASVQQTLQEMLVEQMCDVMSSCVITGEVVREVSDDQTR